jgi:hypothetical protein
MTEPRSTAAPSRFRRWAITGSKQSARDSSRTARLNSPSRLDDRASLLLRSSARVLRHVPPIEVGWLLLSRGLGVPRLRRLRGNVRHTQRVMRVNAGAHRAQRWPSAARSHGDAAPVETSYPDPDERVSPGPTPLEPTT